MEPKPALTHLDRIGCIWNSVGGRPEQADVGKWAKETYPDIWAELEKMGLTRNRRGQEMFPIEREFSP